MIMNLTDLNIPTIICEVNGHVIYVSRSFTDITGYSMQDLEGEASILCTDADTLKKITDLMNSRAHIIDQIVYYTKQQQAVTFRIDIKPVYDGDALLGYIGIYLDVTETERQIQENHDIITSLVNEINLKNNLLSLLRHDIRDSLSCVKALESMGEITDSFIIGAVNACLDIATRSTGDGVSTNVKQSIDQAIKDTAYLASLSGISVVNEVPASLRMDIYSGYLFLVARNYIANSIKNSPAHSKITVTIVEDSLCFIDRGKGISPQTIQHLMEGNVDIRSNTSGRGFILCRQLLTAHGYSVKILSTPGTGCVILVYRK